MKPIKAIVFLPGTMFWALVIYGIATKNETAIGLAVTLAVVTVITIVTMKIRSSAAERAERRRVWSEGIAGTARVVSIGTKGGAINDHPLVDFELEVTVDGKAPYRANVSAYVSSLAVPRIQPDCQIAVRVDREDPTRVLIDAALTPYGYR